MVANFSSLPPEIVEEIFVHLSITDLISNASLVCSKWRQIALRSGFLPWKKLYFQYKFRSLKGFLRISRILEDSSENDSDVVSNEMILFKDEDNSSLMYYHDELRETLKIPWCSESFLPWLLRFISAHFKSANYEAVRRHPLFQLTLLTTTERFHKFGSHNGVVVAVLAIIAADVWAVRHLIRILSIKCKILDIVEILYCVCTWLTVAKRLTNIPPRYEYNIYHALYFLENEGKFEEESTNFAPTEAKRRHRQVGQQSLFQMGFVRRDSENTAEQNRILYHPIDRRDVIKIEALAGSGKTTTLLKLTQHYPNKKFLLITFNRNTRDRACRTFPKSNVVCQTVHSMAFSKCGVFYKHKLAPNLKAQTIYNSGVMVKPSYKRAAQILETLKRFINSQDFELSEENVPGLWPNPDDDGKKDEVISIDQRDSILREASRVWAIMTDPNNSSIPQTHDGYLKLWQLRKPNLQNLAAHDVLLVDEAQDMSPPMLNILERQDCAKVIVGDPNQQIYSFRGAVNALRSFKANRIFYLSQSFRFGPEIAFVANCCLEKLKLQDERYLVGGRTMDRLVASDRDISGPLTIIGRSNCRLFYEIVHRICDSEEHNKKGCILGDDKLDDYQSLLELRDGNHHLMTKFKTFKTFASFEYFAKQTNDVQLQSIIRIVKAHNSERLRKILRIIRDRCRYRESLADFVFTTAHQAKGLEWDSVYVLDDFIDTDTLDQDFDYDHDDEKNLLYVAITRAKKNLVLTKPVYGLLGSCNYFFTRLEAVLKNASTIVCVRCGRNFSSASSHFLVYEFPLNGIRDNNGYLCSFCSVSEKRDVKVLQTSNNIYLHPVTTVSRVDMNNRLFRFLIGPKKNEMPLNDSQI